MLKISAALMLGAFALPSIGANRPASEMPRTLEARALELGFRMDLVEELAGRKCFSCSCSLVSNGFPLTFNGCNFGSTSLTETVACTGGATTCTISGNMTWTPDCGPPCCGSGTEWKDGSAPQGSHAYFTDGLFLSSIGTFSNCTPGNFFATAQSLQTACDGHLYAVAGIKKCDGTVLVFPNITWSAIKEFSCDTTN